MFSSGNLSWDLGSLEKPCVVSLVLRIQREGKGRGKDRGEWGTKDLFVSFTILFGTSCDWSLHISSIQIDSESTKSCFTY